MMKVHPNTLAAYLEVAKQAAMEAGDVLKKYFRKLDASMIEEKAANDFVTDVDRRSEQIIKNHIITHFSIMPYWRKSLKHKQIPLPFYGSSTH